MKKKLMILLMVVAIVATACVFIFAGCDNSTTKIKIGVLHINPLQSTEGYTYAHQQGIEQAKTALGLSDDDFVYKDSLADTDSAAIKTAIEELIADGCNMIIGTSFGYQDQMIEFAKKDEYKNIIFSHGTGYLNTMGEGENNNMNNYFGRIYQVRYLSGIVAGMKSLELGNDNLGFVCAQGTDVAECTSGVNAFTLGAQSVNPNAKVYVKVMNSWYDDTKEREYAQTLIKDYNCGIVTQHCDTKNPSTVARDAGKFSIGYNSDMGLAVKKAGEDRNSSVLTSVLWNWGTYYTKAIKAAMDCFDDNGALVNKDAWKQLGNYYGSFADGLFQLAPFSDEVSADTKAIVEAVEAVMKKGTSEWDVFTNRAMKFTKGEDGKYAIEYVERDLVDHNGNVVASDSVKITDANIQGNMPYWVKGVTVVA